LQIILYILRMGTLSSLLSDPLVKGFTTAAAIHVIVSQLKDMLGVKIPLYKGAFNIIHTLVDIVRYAKNANLVALGVSFFVILILLAMNDYLKVFFNQPIFLKNPYSYLTFSHICSKNINFRCHRS
jgi:solute carrier family 26, other